MQKFVTIYLSESNKKNQKQTEHLEDYLAEGWSIVSITPMGGGGGASYCVAGWFGVLMEK